MPTTARRRSLVGEKIGNYAVVSTLGEGGMGTVYLAEHPIIGRRVAIKVLHDGGAERAEAAARCFVEARAIGEIRHPNVVDVIDCGVADLGDGPVHYLVMEHLEGRSLREELGAGALPAARAIAIAIEVGRALAAAHGKGIVHRDIKPENIFLVGPAGTEPPAVKILDFGIAKLMDGHPFGAPLTQSGVTLGTPTYMAPEQLDGEDLDGRVDVYALGIVLFEMLTGAAPFADEPTARGVWHRMNEVPPLPDGLELPEGTGELLLRALDPDRVRRPSMSELVRGLADPSAIAEGEPHTRRVARAQMPQRTRHAPQAAPRRRWHLVAAVGLVSGAAAALLAPRLWRGGGGGEAEVAPPPPAVAPSRPAPPASRDAPAAPPAPASRGAPAAPPAPASRDAPAAPPRAAPSLPVPRSKPGHGAGSAPPLAPVPAAAPDAGAPAPSPPPPPPPPRPDAGPPRGLGDNLMPPRERP
jgi:hypothetical protein